MSSDPLLVAMLDGGRVALLLDGKKGVPHRGALRTYAKEPLLSIGAPIDAATLSPELKSHLAPRYRVGLVDGTTTAAVREDVVLLHRIVADDPFLNRVPGESDSDFTGRAFEQGEGGIVAIVRLEATRSKASPALLWAIPEGAPIPQALARQTLPAQKVRPVLAKTSDYADALVLRSGLPDVAAVAFGETFVWAKLTSPPSPSPPPTPCFALRKSKEVLRLVGTAPSCPDTPLGAMLGAENRVAVWFDFARATVTADAVEVVYFPVASHALSGGP